MARKEHISALVVVILGTLFVSFLDLNREYFAFGTETDYLGSFMPEAQRFLGGDPLLLETHPPLYSIVVAVVQIVVGDWFTTGLLLSAISSAIVLGTSFLFFRLLCGRWAGWGAMLGLLASNTFVTYSALATSDVFFLALCSVALLFVLLAMRFGSLGLWTTCGLFVGCVLLTRANGISLLLLVFAPLLGALPRKGKLKNLVAMIAGASIPLLAWSAYATYSDSPLYPTSTQYLLALTYFAPSADRISGDAITAVQGAFRGENAFQILMHDPTHVAKVYLTDLYTLLTRALSTTPLLVFPLNLLALPGLLLICMRGTKEFFFYLFFVVAAQLLLINFKAYEERYLLFLVPLLGAAAGHAYGEILEAAKKHAATLPLVIAALVICGAVAGVSSFLAVWLRLPKDEVELSSLVPVARKVASDCSALAARKPHLPFYLGCNYLGLPMGTNLDALKAFLAQQPARGSIYIYYGSVEQQLRRELSILKSPARAPEWLEAVAGDAYGKGWWLYRYKAKMK